MAAKKGKAWSEADEAKLMKMYNDGASHADIAKALKRTKTSVSQRIYKMNKSPDTRSAIGSVKDNKNVANALESASDAYNIEETMPAAHEEEKDYKTVIAAVILAVAVFASLVLGYTP